MTMRISRRAFNGGLAGLAAAGSTAFGVEPARADVATLEANTGFAELAPPELPATPIWGYEGQVPGPLIPRPTGRARQTPVRQQSAAGFDRALAWHQDR